MINLVYINDGLSSVFDSQVLELLQEIRKSPEIQSIFLICGYKSEEEKTTIKNKAESCIENILFYKTFPNYPFFNSKNKISLFNILQTLKIDLDHTVYHTRGEMAALHLTYFFKKNHISLDHVLVDVRGSSVEEAQEFIKVNYLLKIFKILNCKRALKNVRKFSLINAVSSSLKNYLINKIDTPKNSVCVIPCLSGNSFKFSENDRMIIRKDLNINENELLFVFSSGGTAGWQNNDVVDKIAQLGYKVLNLSKQEINHPNVINRFINYNTMPAYLSAADIGIIFRGKSIVNKVAAPVKFSEYVCCGLPVISNNSVDSIVEYIQAHNAGIIIDSFEEVNKDSLAILKMIDRKMLSIIGQQTYCLQKISSDYLEVYKKMASK